MAIKTITEFLAIDTVKIWAYFYDEDDALVNPTTSITIDIYDPDGTLQVDGAAMTNSDTGIYYYYYHKGDSADPMAKGNWRGTIKAVDGLGVDAVVSTGNFHFKVK